MPGDIRKLTNRWNRIIRLVKATRATWEEFLKDQKDFSREDLENCPILLQKAMALFGRSKFEIFLPRLVEYYIRYGGIEELEVKLEGKEKKNA